MSKTVKYTVIGGSGDIGLLSETNFNPVFDRKIWRILLKSIPAILVWGLQEMTLPLIFRGNRHKVRQIIKDTSRKNFSFLMSRHTLHEHPEGFLRRLKDKLGVDIEFTNNSSIGCMLSTVLKNKDVIIPSDSDFVFLCLGGIEFMADMPPERFREKYRETLLEIANRNPNARVITCSIHNLVWCLSSETNRNRLVRAPIFPTVHWIHTRMGYNQKTGLNHQTDDATKIAYRKRQELYNRIIEEEALSLVEQGVISCTTFLDVTMMELCEDESRHLYTALDGLHPTTATVDAAVAKLWPVLEADIERDAQWRVRRLA